MNANVVEHLSMETALRQALERDEFLLHHQPRVGRKINSPPLPAEEATRLLSDGKKL